MARQTFTVAQVVTAAVMNTLQTNDFNQTVSTKTANYTLVASDAGTKIVMNSASATTITVNTSLFSAGDTLTLLNIGAGVCTITAGTATVSSSTSLLLVQYGGGTLYFSSAGVSVFQASGVAVTAGGMTLLSTTTLTGASTTVSGIDQTYTALQIYILNAYSSVTSGYLRCYMNGDSTSGNYESSTNRTRSGSSGLASDTWVWAGWVFYNSTASNFTSVNLPNYSNSTRCT
jgi:hypothetical protein